MSKRLDEADAVITLASAYFKAMLDGDEEVLRDIFHPKASIIGNDNGALDFMSLDEFIAITPEADRKSVV